MARSRRSYERESGNRPTKRMCVVATEDSVSGAYAYLSLLVSTFDERFVVRIGELVPSDKGRSAPRYVFNRLRKFEYDYSFDTCWLVADVDRWGTNTLDQIIAQCAELKGFHTAISNNCFEIWLLYHQQGFNKQFATSRECKEAGKSFADGLGGLQNLITEGRIRVAIEKAKSLPSARESWPQTQGSHLFKLLEYLMDGNLPE